MNFLIFLLFLQILAFVNVESAGGKIRAKINKKIIGTRKWFNPKPFEKWAKNVAEKSMEQLKSEFQGQLDTASPIEATRVKLSDHTSIHANFVKDAGKAKLICTEGPQQWLIPEVTKKNIVAFWQMIVEQKIDAIAMVTDTMEGREKKCAQYWPLSKKDTENNSFNGYTIEFVEKVPLVDEQGVAINIVKTELVVTSPKGVAQKVAHFHWMGWPDHGVPENVNYPFLLWDALKLYNNIAVHCSAGVGRTGTIVTIGMGLHFMEIGKSLNIPGIVKKLRKARPGSVQHLDQYLYIYNVFLSYAKHEATNGNIELNERQIAGIDNLIEQITKKISEKF